MKNIISALVLLFSAALVFSAPAEARGYDASKPPKPGERAHAVLNALNSQRGPVCLKYRTDGEDGCATVTFASNGSKAYTDVESAEGRISTLYDAKTGNVVIISHNTKTYVVAPSAPVVLPFEETLERAAGGEFKSSSGSEKIKGARYDFDKIVWDDGTEETLYFVPMTDTLKWWRTGGELAEVLEYGGRGVKDEFFKIPAGYKETKLPM